MPSTDTQNCACGRPSGDDAYVCTGCADHARGALRHIVDGLDVDLTVTLAKQDQIGDPNAGHETKPTKASEAPLPLNLRAVEARSILRNTLVTWVRIVHSDGSSATSLPGDTIDAMARWLLPTVGWIRHRGYGPEFVDEIGAAVAQALRAVDLAVRRVPLPAACTHIRLEGLTPISCGGALHAVVAPGLPIDGQVRCEHDPAHTTTVAEHAAEKQKAHNRKGRLRARLTKGLL